MNPQTSSSETVNYGRWPGELPIFHRYTLGAAGQRFFQAFRDDTRIFASLCPKCDKRFLLPKIYCERCFVATTDWSAVDGPAGVISFTILRQSLDGETLDTPQIVAFLSWPGVRGGLTHLLGEIEPAEARTGMEVTPKWRAERIGAITDIEYFRPA